MKLIEDPEVLSFKEVGDHLRQNDSDLIKAKENDIIWNDSPFDWIRRLAPRAKGRIGKILISNWCTQKGLEVEEIKVKNIDRVIAGKRVVIRLSTLWENGEYKFQQLLDKEYDQVICLGISLCNVHCWVIPKEVVWEKCVSQHGKDRWVSINVSQPDKWVTHYGGRLEQAIDIMKKW